MSEGRPLLSLIIPVYNVRPYLAECLDSAVSQTLKDMEIVIVDDGSTDGCGQICDSYAACDERVTVCHTENKGLAAARNYGLDRICGKYVAFLDSDDWLEDDALQKLLEAIERHGADIAVCSFANEYDGKTVPSKRIEQETLLDNKQL
ncbi:MAG: glycosyltransferase family 2 protein, partial [Oscillospiraceae bacterium]|nr:glycosyltransferase family 2 protein [Oscillospiraceae bacterium]